MKRAKDNFRMSTSLFNDLNRWYDNLTKNYEILEEKANFLINNATGEKDESKKMIDEELDFIEDYLIKIREITEQTLGVDVDTIDSTQIVIENISKYTESLKIFRIAIRDYWKAHDYSNGGINEEVAKTLSQEKNTFSNSRKEFGTSLNMLLDEISGLLEEVGDLSNRKIL